MQRRRLWGDCVVYRVALRPPHRELPGKEETCWHRKLSANSQMAWPFRSTLKTQLDPGVEIPGRPVGPMGRELSWRGTAPQKHKVPGVKHWSQSLMYFARNIAQRIPELGGRRQEHIVLWSDLASPSQNIYYHFQSSEKLGW